MKKALIVLAVLVALLLGARHYLLSGVTVNAPMAQFLYAYTGKVPASEDVGARMKVAAGYEVSVWAQGLAGARMLALTPQGHLLVSLPRQGRVVEIQIGEHGEALAVKDVLTELDRPHGLAVTDQWLYVAEGTAVVRIPVQPNGEIAAVGSAAVERIITGLPDGGNHWTRTVGVGPDGRLYISVGSSCNVCEEIEPWRAAMLVAEPDGSDLRVFASGLRNAVGFDWQPGTGELYATDNGRDLLGDDFPPCELNRIVDGGFYGWPYANGDNVPDPDFGAGNDDKIQDSRLPAFAFTAHTAPLGIRFLSNVKQRKDLQGAALVALHGSWNRSKKSGYKVLSVHWSEDGSVESRDFLTGFELDEDVIGRPVDVAEGLDGSIYISDDFAGVIWRVSRVEAGGPVADAASIQPLAASLPASAKVDASSPPGQLSQMAAAGARLFADNHCGTCHLAEQAGPNVVAHTLYNLGERYNVSSLSQFFLAPTPPMPAYSLEKAERDALAVYLLTEFGGVL